MSFQQGSVKVLRPHCSRSALCALTVKTRNNGSQDVREVVLSYIPTERKELLQTDKRIIRLLRTRGWSMGRGLANTVSWPSSLGVGICVATCSAKMVWAPWQYPSPRATMTFTNDSTFMPHRPSRDAISRVALLAAYSRAGKRKHATADASLLTLSRFQNFEKHYDQASNRLKATSGPTSDQMSTAKQFGSEPISRELPKNIILSLKSFFLEQHAHRVPEEGSGISLIDSMTSVSNTDASLPYNHDLSESRILKRIKVDGKWTHSGVRTPPDTYSGNLHRNVSNQAQLGLRGPHARRRDAPTEPRLLLISFIPPAEASHSELNTENSSLRQMMVRYVKYMA
ncbi:hypothetical protein CSKR_110452 [Clonorchis sinensis]|uniref:Uncharacterized protein n=1 Tax=Clonorchis sinensis TaxID=79923 RepID=A0A3R7FX83_CLOSI|nr:hypothetical protein CSKR_110452 [Clonorchis sinensis]